MKDSTNSKKSSFLPHHGHTLEPLHNPPTSSLHCILLLIYQLFLYTRYHPNIQLDPLLIHNPLCNCDNRRYRGGLGGGWNLAIVVVNIEHAVDLLFL